MASYPRDEPTPAYLKGLKAIMSNASKQTQIDKFKDAARKAGCDENETRWDERLKKVAKAKPDEPKP